ncbi:hypothetical protein BD311DRAFT_760266 [Dichomitus squalens]|uniref:Uncharacterized protein n=1 Tax=Dichomitus squalens TaxID=114155 RepID=A0A4Q9MJ14_9APHY|nr:hypothetical protein BD311DRAFT_760266 [Dichomitus squalens]
MPFLHRLPQAEYLRRVQDQQPTPRPRRPSTLTLSSISREAVVFPLLSCAYPPVVVSPVDVVRPVLEPVQRADHPLMIPQLVRSFRNTGTRTSRPVQPSESIWAKTPKGSLGVRLHEIRPSQGTPTDVLWGELLGFAVLVREAVHEFG